MSVTALLHTVGYLQVGDPQSQWVMSPGVTVTRCCDQMEMVPVARGEFEEM